MLNFIVKILIMKRILLFFVCFVLASFIKVSAQTPVDSFVKQVGYSAGGAIQILQLKS